MSLRRALLLILVLAASTAWGQSLETLPATSQARHLRLTEGATFDPARFDVDLPRAAAPAAGYPVIVIVPGLGCQAEDYSIVRKRLIQSGYAVATFEWKDNEDYDADDWDERLAVLTELLLDYDQAAQGELAGALDEDELGLMGHSLGGSVAVLAAARDARFKALAIFGPGGKQTDFLDARVSQPTIAIDGSLDRVTPPDEASGVVLENATTRYTGHVIVTDGNHPNAPANYDTDFIRDSGRFVMKPNPLWPWLLVPVYEFPIVEGITPVEGRLQRQIAFPYLIGWFDRFVAKAEKPLDLVARGKAELAAGKLTRARFSPAVSGGSGILGALGNN